MILLFIIICLLTYTPRSLYHWSGITVLSSLMYMFVKKSFTWLQLPFGSAVYCSSSTVQYLLFIVAVLVFRTCKCLCITLYIMKMKVCYCHSGPTHIPNLNLFVYWHSGDFCRVRASDSFRSSTRQFYVGSGQASYQRIFLTLELSKEINSAAKGKWSEHVRRRSCNPTAQV